MNDQEPRSKIIRFPKHSNDPPHEVVINGHLYRLAAAEVSGGAFGPAAEMLTERECQIALLVAQGKVNKQIADILEISEYTVSTHLRRIFAKLKVDSRAAMVSRCMERNQK